MRADPVESRALRDFGCTCRLSGRETDQSETGSPTVHDVAGTRLDRARVKRLWFIVVGLTLIGIVARLWLLRHAISEANSDDFYVGLQAIAIRDGDRPILVRGVGYGAVVDSYLLAPIYSFGHLPITFLKFVTSFWWAIAAVVTTMVSRRLTRLSSNVADETYLIAGALIWITPGSLLVVSTRSLMAYGLLFLGIAVTQYVAIRSIETGGTATGWSVLLGISAGLTFFFHPITLAAIVPILLITTFRARREFRTYWVPVTLGVIGSNLGFLAWNIKNSWLSLAVPPASDSYVDRLEGIFTGLLPRAFGFMDFDGEWTSGPLSKMLYFLVLAIGLVGVTSLAQRGWVGVVIAFPAVFVWPTLAYLSSSSFVADGRYAVVGVSQFVLLVVAGLQVISRFVHLGDGKRSRSLSSALPVLAAGVWVFVGGFLWLQGNSGSAVDDPNSRMRAVTTLLQVEDVEYAAGNFWHVLPVEYLSDGDIHVAVAGHPWGAHVEWRPNLPWAVFFPMRQIEIAGQPDEAVAFIFDAADEQVSALRMPPDRYVRHSVGTSIVYIPLR